MDLLAVAAIIGLAVFILLMREPAWGVLLIFPVSFFLAPGIQTGRQTSLSAPFLYLALLYPAWIARMMIVKKWVRLQPSTMNGPVSLFLVSSVISLLFGNLVLLLQTHEKASFTAQVGAWGLYAFSVAIILLVGNVVRERRWLERMILAFLGLGGLYTLILLAFGLSSPAAAFFGEGVNSSPFWIVMVALSFGLFLFRDDLSWSMRLAGLCLALACLAQGWLNGKEWLAGWLPPLFAALLLVWLKSWKWGLAVTGLGALVAGLGSIYLSSQIYTPNQQWSTYTRFLTWPVMFSIFKASPVFGVGFAHYFYYTVNFSFGGYSLHLNSHNNYWDLAVQMGLVGLGVFAWLAFRLGRLGWRLRGQAQDPFTLAYANCCLAILAALLLSGVMADWFLPFVFNIGFPGFRTSILAWAFLGGLVSLEVMQRKSLSTPQIDENSRYDA